MTIEYEDNRPVSFDCPHCGNHIDTRTESYEEATVGSSPDSNGNFPIPHITCRNCEHCCGCTYNDISNDPPLIETLYDTENMEPELKQELEKFYNSKTTPPNNL